MRDRCYGGAVAGAAGYRGRRGSVGAMRDKAEIEKAESRNKQRLGGKVRADCRPLLRSVLIAFLRVPVRLCGQVHLRERCYGGAVAGAAGYRGSREKQKLRKQKAEIRSRAAGIAPLLISAFCFPAFCFSPAAFCFSTADYACHPPIRPPSSPQSRQSRPAARKLRAFRLRRAAGVFGPDPSRNL
jgi:uncharacterized C2H2 Zn-finger protein